MSLFKRICSIVLAVALVLTVFTVAIYAGTSAETPESYAVTVKNKTVTEGATNQSVDVTLAGNGAYGVQLDLEYNDALIEVTDVTLPAALSSAYLKMNITDGKVSFMVFNSEAIPAGTIASIKFNALAIVDKTSTMLDVTKCVLSDSKGERIADGMVTAASGEVCSFPSGIAKLSLPGSMISLKDNVKFSFMAADSLASDYNDIYAVIELDGVEKKVYPNAEKYDGTYFQFDFENINPTQYGKTLTATLYGEHGGKYYQAITKYKSVVDYCVEEYTGGTSSQKLKTLMADLLVYGADIQIYTGDTSPLCTDDARVASYVEANRTKADVAPESNKNNKEKECETRTVLWSAASLSLGTSVSPCIVFNTTENLDDFEIRVYDDSDNLVKTFTKPSFEYYDVHPSSGRDLYQVRITGYSVAQMRKPLHIVAYKNDVIVSRTYKYTIESYAYDTINDVNSSAELIAACKSMVKYGRSAEEYVKK